MSEFMLQGYMLDQESITILVDQANYLDLLGY